MSNYIFNPPQQNYHNNQKIDLGDIRVSKVVQVPEISKIIFYGEPLMDLTNDTVTPEVLMEGYTAHAANGDMIIGNMQGGGGEELANSYTAVINNEYRMGGSCAYMFNGNTVFNQPVTIGNNVNNCAYMFSYCYNFNQPVTIGNNVNNCAYMFNNCKNFNQPVIIPDNVTSCAYMFSQCINFNQNIYIKSINVSNVRNMLASHNSQKQINLFCTNLTSLNKTTAETSLTGTAITWASMTNGYYNATYNIYLYNNLPA